MMNSLETKAWNYKQKNGTITEWNGTKDTLSKTKKNVKSLLSLIVIINKKRKLFKVTKSCEHS